MNKENLQCLLTGQPQNEMPIKRMCLNCAYLKNNSICLNSDVMSNAINRAQKAVLDLGLDIETLNLKPIKIKNLRGKCDYHKADMIKIQTYIDSLFVTTEEK